MSDQQKEFLRKLRITLIAILTPFLITTILSSMSFYYNTKNALKNCEDRNNRQDVEIEKKVDKDVYNEVIKNIDQDLIDIKKHRKKG